MYSRTVDLETPRVSFTGVSQNRIGGLMRICRKLFSTYQNAPNKATFALYTPVFRKRAALHELNLSDAHLTNKMFEIWSYEGYEIYGQT